MPRLRWFSMTVALLSVGCLGSQSAGARAQEAASELNVNARFGRMEMAAEHVAPAQREAFFARRKAWGGSVRVADYELAGLRMRGKTDAESFVRVAWYRVDQGDLRTTTLKQSWHDFKGAWQLVAEDRADGDIGLLGEPMPAAPAPSTPAVKNAQFPTIRLGAPAPSSPPAAKAEEAD
jgi:hypothetical protein